jgi:hypothetical protein
MFAKRHQVRDNRGTPPFKGARPDFAFLKGSMFRIGLAVLLAFALPAPVIAHAHVPASSEWTLRGHVLPGAAEEHGHYEVGLFTVLGADGLPVGYPLVQAILPAGRTAFRLKVPARLARAYLFAEFVEDASGHRRWIVPTANPWTSATPQPAELFLRVDAVHSHFASPSPAPMPAKTSSTSLPAASPAPVPAPTPSAAGAPGFLVRGSVGTMFSASPIPQAGVTVRVRGRKEMVLTSSRGEFVLPLPELRGRIALEFLKDGYQAEVISVNAANNQPVHVDLAARSALQQMAQHLGLAQGDTLGVVLGRALDEKGAPLPGLSATLSRKAEGPFYFDEPGVPSRELRATSSDGRFLFLNVEAGAGFLETEVNGEALAPVRVSTAEGGELLLKEVIPLSGTLAGHIYEAVKKGGPAPLVGARVRIEGMTEWTTSDSLGAFRLGPFRWSRGERVSLMFSAANYQNHRYQISPGESDHHLYAFPAHYLEKLAESHDVGIDPFMGVVIGRALGPSVRIDALSDEPGPNPVRDFYFDANGRMRPAPAMTDPRFGTYMLFNLPAGHANLFGSDADGMLRFGRDVFAGPSVVSVEVDQ